MLDQIPTEFLNKPLLRETDFDLFDKIEHYNVVPKNNIQKHVPKSPNRKIVWRNVIVMFTIHALGLYGFTFLHLIHWKTLAFTYVLAILSSLGVQAGAHRLWAHRSYKASFGLRLFLSFCHVLALQNDLYEWGKPLTNVDLYVKVYLFLISVYSARPSGTS